MGKIGPKLSEEEKEQIFQIAIKRYRVKHYGLYHREVRRIANRLCETPENVRARLRKAGFVLTKSRSGCCDVWKASKLQSPHIKISED